jgi:RNA polymerase sigma-70 factor (ECF subfamily)
VFVLREVFDLPFDEIAEAVGKSPAAVRQIAHRARSHVHARRPRQDVTAEERDRVIERFLAAAATGDLQSLMDVLAPDVVLVSDGGGRKKAALRPIHGRDKVLRFLTATSQNQGEITAEVLTVNGGPALALSIDGELDTVATFVIEDGVVTGLYLLRNPEKLSRLGQVVDLTR